MQVTCQDKESGSERESAPLRETHCRRGGSERDWPRGTREGMRREGREEARGDVWRGCVVTSREQRLCIERSVEAAGVGVEQRGSRSGCGAKSVSHSWSKECLSTALSAGTTGFISLACYAANLSISIVSLHSPLTLTKLGQEGKGGKGGGEGRPRSGREVMSISTPASTSFDSTAPVRVCV